MRGDWFPFKVDYLPVMPTATELPRPVQKLFLSSPVFDSGRLGIEGVGVREWMRPGFVDRPQGTGDWLLMVFHQPVTVGVAGRRQAVAGRTLMVWRPDQGHFYGALGQPWLHSWIHASGEAVGQLVTACGLPCGKPIADCDPTWLERACLDLHQEIAAHAQPDPVIAENALHTFLRQVARTLRPAEAAVPPALLAVRRHLETHLAEPTSLAGLARLAGLSPNHFCGEFRRHFTVAPIDYLIRLRLDQARLLLRDRNLSIAQVAAAVGYADAHYFARLFRRRFGCPPRALR